MVVIHISAGKINVNLKWMQAVLYKREKTKQRLVANMMVSLVSAYLAMHTAAPHKAATTLLLMITDPGLIPSTAAEQATAVKSS